MYNILLVDRDTPLSPDFTTSHQGSISADGNSLIFEKEDYEQCANDPIVRKYLREYVTGGALIDNTPRWCLWIPDNFDTTDLNKSKLLRERIEKCADYRKTASSLQTRKKADTPFQFLTRKELDYTYLAIPVIVSHRRKYLTVEYIDSKVIPGGTVHYAKDEDGLLFSILSSTQFITWQKTVGGRLKSDYRYSSTLVLNNFPLPELSQKQKTEIIRCGLNIQKIRKEQGKTLEELYNPLAMHPELKKAHDKLDKALDSVFGLKNPTETERLTALFEHYERMTSV